MKLYKEQSGKMVLGICHTPGIYGEGPGPGPGPGIVVSIGYLAQLERWLNSLYKIRNNYVNIFIKRLKNFVL